MGCGTDPTTRSYTEITLGSFLYAGSCKTWYMVVSTCIDLRERNFKTKSTLLKRGLRSSRTIKMLVHHDTKSVQGLLCARCAEERGNREYMEYIRDNAVCVVTHVNDCLVVHIRKFKQTISNNESQCRDNLIYLHLLHRNLFTEKTQECAPHVGHLHSSNCAWREAEAGQQIQQKTCHNLHTF